MVCYVLLSMVVLRTKKIEPFKAIFDVMHGKKLMTA